MYKILIIDDEPEIRKFLRITLSSQHYDVITADNGRDGVSQAVLGKPDLVILDMGLPDLDGKWVLQNILSETFIPVIVLSVRSSETEKVMALDMGAQDYVVKPFSVNELLARIRRILSQQLPGQDRQSTLYDDGVLKVDVDSRQVFVNGEPVSVTRKEWAVLRQLMETPGRLVTQTALLQQVWGKSHTEDTQYLRNVIQKLRQKLGDNASSPRFIETEPGVGYRFLPSTDQT